MDGIKVRLPNSREVTFFDIFYLGHSGDNILYVSKDGKLQTVAGTSSWGCSHNEGIAFEEADSPPFASLCAEDHTGIWLNTKTRGMNGIKISNEVRLAIQS
jgi:hypothetical protein